MVSKDAYFRRLPFGCPFLTLLDNNFEIPAYAGIETREMQDISPPTWHSHEPYFKFPLRYAYVFYVILPAPANRYAWCDYNRNRIVFTILNVPLRFALGFSKENILGAKYDRLFRESWFSFPASRLPKL